jgi:hypothetical protein
MLDMSKYAEHFPDEGPDAPGADGRTAATHDPLQPSPALLTALSQLEKEFSEILRTQQPEAGDRSKGRPASAT